MSSTETQQPDFGEKVEGIDIPVFNERAVRAAAGLLFVVGFSAAATAFFTGDIQPLRGFGILFLIDMGIRLTLNHRFAPSMALGSLIVRRQRPEWVGAAQKRLAWGIGFGMAFVGCLRKLHPSCARETPVLTNRLPGARFSRATKACCESPKDPQKTG
jgi:hypothetical protein